MIYIDEKELNSLISQWFKEDIGDGDHTSLSSIPADVEGCQQLILKVTFSQETVTVCLNEAGMT